MSDDPTPSEPIVIVETHTTNDGHGHTTFDQTAIVIGDSPAEFVRSENIGGRGEPPIETKPSNWGGETPAKPDQKP